MRTVDGFIHRLIDGTKVLAVSKDGQSMTVHAENGERWQIWFVNPNTGELIPGEPSVTGTEAFRLRDGDMAFPKDGHVHSFLVGQTIEKVQSNGQQLLFMLVGGAKVMVAWVDEHGQQFPQVEPCLRKVDVVVTLPGVCAFPEANF